MKYGGKKMKGLKATILDLGCNYSDGNFFEAGKYRLFPIIIDKISPLVIPYF